MLRSRPRGAVRICIITSVIAWTMLGAGTASCEDAGSEVVVRVNDGRSWPTLHGDLLRSGYYPTFPQPPLGLAWRVELFPELVGARCEPIVAGGLVFVGTYAGHLIALDQRDGARRWTWKASGPIWHSPMWSEGTLVCGALDGYLYALSAQDGSLRWKYRSAAGWAASPTVNEGRVMIGDRAGLFHCLDLQTGSPLWTTSTAGRILTTASLSPDGRHVLFGSEDMRVRCAEVATGRLVWSSDRLHGLSLRDYFPTVVNGLVLVSTNPVDGFHDVMNRHQEMLLARVGRKSGDDDYRFVPGGPAEVEAEQQAIVDYLRQHPDEQTFYALDIETGQQPWVAPVLYTSGLHNPPAPPCVDRATNAVYVLVRSAFTVWDGGGEVRPLTGVGRLDVATGRVTLLEHRHRPPDESRPAGSPDMPFASFNTIGDETQALSCAPGWLFSNHQGFLGSLNLETGRCQSLFGRRDTYAGFYGPGVFGWEDQGGVAKAQAAGQPYGLVNEWHGPARGIAAVVGQQVFYIAGSQVLCFEGK
jgi:outer membrane protein assembly factor BamB